MQGGCSLSRRYRVLVIAEAANPEWVSVPLEGWSMSNALREVADVHIVTQVRNAPAFERAGLKQGVDFTAIDSERLAAPVYKLANLVRGGAGKGWTTEMALYALTYPYFERLVWKRFGPAIRAGAYDIIHRVTPLSPTAASPIARKCARAGTPFMLGPLNGGLPWPKAFSAERHKEKEWLSYVRGAYKLLPGRRDTLRAARAIIAGSRHTQSEIPAEFQDKVIYVPENGLEPDRFDRLADYPAEGPVRMCFVGRLVPYKGADMAIDAAQDLLREGRAHLDIVGDGPMMGELKARVESAGIGHAVTFHGWVEHQRVQSITSRCSVFLFPSVREFGGAVVLEAMALGLVPVVVDYGGPGELAGDGRGLTVPMGTRQTIIAETRKALEWLANHQSEIPAMGQAARAWSIDNLTWPAKARNMAKIYAWVAGDEPRRPAPYEA
jgi:glycosyltransferase involved in cell wall biosynthesis